MTVLAYSMSGTKIQYQGSIRLYQVKCKFWGLFEGKYFSFQLLDFNSYLEEHGYSQHLRFEIHKTGNLKPLPKVLTLIF